MKSVRGRRNQVSLYHDIVNHILSRANFGAAAENSQSRAPFDQKLEASIDTPSWKPLCLWIFFLRQAIQLIRNDAIVYFLLILFEGICGIVVISIGWQSFKESNVFDLDFGEGLSVANFELVMAWRKGIQCFDALHLKVGLQMIESPSLSKVEEELSNNLLHLKQSGLQPCSWKSYLSWFLSKSFALIQLGKCLRLSLSLGYFEGQIIDCDLFSSKFGDLLIFDSFIHFQIVGVELNS